MAIFNLGKGQSQAVRQSDTSFGNERILFCTYVLPESSEATCVIRYKNYIRVAESVLP